MIIHHMYDPGMDLDVSYLKKFLSFNYISYQPSENSFN